jgi:hypothetical protein
MAAGKALNGFGCFWAAILFAGAGLPSQSAGAVELAVSGSTLMLSGPIVQGDEYKFRDFLKDAGAGRVTTIRLDSGGGNIFAAGAIARIIRGAGLTTVVDASRSKCASACTILFAAGVRRLYLNADGLEGGVVACQGFRGLGYHQGASPGMAASNRYSGAGTAEMISLIYEMGASSAAGLIDNSTPDSVYRPSTQKALELGIATHTRG